MYIRLSTLHVHVCACMYMYIFRFSLQLRFREKVLVSSGLNEYVGYQGIVCLEHPEVWFGLPSGKNSSPRNACHEWLTVSGSDVVIMFPVVFNFLFCSRMSCCRPSAGPCGVLTC